eukprot:Plantae.Rhodophyta-Rhodochaete_pulchella.ctg74856.p1 GENE.Plantae.Rhodophyta-Rhodochaete_pulchella.ctg74856~~Plantae.Rhodophyta-Rhodochaete_pulchella.ctg74856.p1  ORF type:complete len:209 (+),score=12.17 Plantae.Rhodophyta-Rhodochaete_pulchella.ctg74856:155-781(+)
MISPPMNSFVDLRSVPMKRNQGHLYVAMSIKTSNVNFTTSQLLKLHRQFSHASAEKLYNLRRKARPEDTPPDTLRRLKELSRRCDTCQRIANAPTRFKVSFGADNIAFNEKVLLDVMYLEGKPVLHLVDDGTHFSAARFIPDVSTKTIWSTILQRWATVYTGLPNKLSVDQGTCFSPLFASIASMSNVQVDRAGTEAHSSLGIGELYH